MLLFEISKSCFLEEEICWNDMFWLHSIINFLLLLISSFLWRNRLLLCFTFDNLSLALFSSNNFGFCRNFLLNLFDFLGSNFDRHWFTLLNFRVGLLQNLFGFISTGWCSRYLLFGSHNSFGWYFLLRFLRILRDGRILWDLTALGLSFWHFWWEFVNESLENIVLFIF